MTPYEIGILLHYYARAYDPSPEEFDMKAPAWRPTIDGFLNLELIKFDQIETPRTYCLTERGRVYVEQGLMEVPLPVQSWHMPKILPTEG
jgi:hypothetical protein